MASAESKLTASPLSELLKKQGFIIIDGGLGTDLETLGFDLSEGGLWSAHLLNKSPEMLQHVHKRFFDAGADLAITSTYQASFSGFETQGIHKQQAIELMQLSIKLAVDTRNMWWEEYLINNNPRFENDDEDGQKKKRKPNQNCTVIKEQKRYKPLIAASIGPYGATISQEYIGNYKDPSNGQKMMSKEQLVQWHLERLDVIGTCPGVDLLAIETIPSYVEAQALVECMNVLFEKYQQQDKNDNLVSKFPRAWICFSCKDEEHINDGNKLSQILDYIEANDKNKTIIGYGVNCTNFNLILKSLPSNLNDNDDEEDQSLGLLTVLCKHQHGRHIIVYPNSGECYDETNRIWKSNNFFEDKNNEHCQPRGEDNQNLIQESSSVTSNVVVQHPQSFRDRFGQGVVLWEKYLESHNLSHELCVGGCCRIGPIEISAIRRALLERTDRTES